MSRSLQETPTWAVATICFVFISFSIFIEYLIHLLGKWLKTHRKTALFEAVEKLKSVLIVLGFMSLILTVSQKSISKICVPTHVANTMLPCTHSKMTTSHLKIVQAYFVWTNSLQETRRLADDDDGDDDHVKDDESTKTSTSTTTPSSSDDYCGSKGMSAIISEEGLNQLSIFIFVLAVMQILYCVLTMALGRAKMRKWKTWEKETQSVEYLAASDPDRFRFMRQTTFARRHLSCTNTSIQLWTKCFFQQFFNSVAKVDYLTLRHGFISAHLSTKNSFNFQKYIQKSLEDDFKVIVGISPLMWFLVAIFMLVDVHGWNAYLWVSFIPLTIVLVLGTKLQVIVARMALQLKDQHSVIKGAPLVQPNDKLFWFNHPKFVLTLLHYTLFMNAFELAFFVWVTLEYGIRSCYHDRIDFIIIRVILAVTVQVMCSYITLPLYALVTQMGSSLKGVVLEEQTTKAIKQWHTGVQERRKREQNNRTITSPELSSHHREPTLGEITTEIPDNDREIVQDTSNEIQIETPEMRKIPTHKS